MAIRTTGLNSLQNNLRDITANLDNTSDLMLDISQILETATQRSFEEEKSPFGRRWKKSQRARRTNTKTLRDTTSSRRDRRGNGQHLQDSINSTHGENFAKVGTNKEYGKFHQLGTSKMEKREFLPIRKNGTIPDEIANEIISVAREHILNI